MNWPAGPPPMPPPGWYADPEQESTWRWWDGTRWTELRAPMWVPPVRDPRSFSAWFDRSFACVRSTLRWFGLVVLGAWSVLGLTAAALAVAVFESDRGRELRRLIGNELTTGGPSRLTDAEDERAWELFGQLVWSTLPWVIALVVVYSVVAAWTYTLAAQSAAVMSGQVEQDTDSLGEHGPSIGTALRRVPVVIAAWIVVGSIALGVVAAVALPVVVVVSSDAGGVAIGLTVVFGLFGGVIVGVWLWVRLGLTIAAAALGGHGLGISRSWALTQGRYWFVFGRLLVASLIGGALGGVTNLIGNFFGWFGFAFSAALVLVLAALVEAFRTIVSASAQVIIVDQTDQTDQTVRRAGSSAPGGYT